MNVVAARLFDINVLAGLAAPDGNQRVPMVRRGDGNRVEVLVLERLANVRNRLRLGLVADLSQAFGIDAAVRIDQVGNFDALLPEPFLDVLAAAAVQPGDGDADAVVGPEDATDGCGGQGGQGADAGGFQKRAA